MQHTGNTIAYKSHGKQNLNTWKWVREWIESCDYYKMRKCQVCVKLNLHLMFDQFMITYSWLSLPRGYYILTSPLPEISSSLVTCVARFPKFTPVPWVAAWTGEIKQPRFTLSKVMQVGVAPPSLKFTFAITFSWRKDIGGYSVSTINSAKLKLLIITGGRSRDGRGWVHWGDIDVHLVCCWPCV